MNSLPALFFVGQADKIIIHLIFVADDTVGDKPYAALFTAVHIRICVNEAVISAAVLFDDFIYFYDIVGENEPFTFAI